LAFRGFIWSRLFLPSPLFDSWIAGPLLAAGIAGVASAYEARLNVLVMIADDLGYGDLGLHGNTGVNTPNLDKLAAEGASFSRFYVQPVCAPTRAEFLTGRDHRSVGVSGVSEGSERLDPDVTTIADSFRRAGYATGLFGKWHNGTQPPYHPICRGFEEFYGFTSGHWGHYFDYWLDHNNQMVSGRGYAANDFTDHTISFMESHRDRPFFRGRRVQHSPTPPCKSPTLGGRGTPVKRFSSRASEPEKEDIPHTRAALAMCENLDWNVGRLLERLDALAIAEDTIVVFFSDNGPNGHRWNSGLRGIKGSTDEGGVRSPLFIRWPKRIPQGAVVTTPACVLDLLPTLSRLCSVDLGESSKLDGLDLSLLLFNRVHKVADDRVIVSQWSGRMAARRGQFLLDHQGRLYDLNTDPGQLRDLAAEWPLVASELAAEVEQRRKRTDRGRRRDAMPFTVGHPSHPTSMLPARDATPLGSVKRSNRHPNCTYFSEWSSPNDAVVWDVEVVTPGTYAVKLFAAVPFDAVGSEVILRAENAESRVVLAEATDCEPLGPAYDRVRRQEGPVKQFKAIPMQSLELTSGRQSLSISFLSNRSDGPAIWQLSLEAAGSNR
jgi:arylsulfatase A-like enzyme